MNSVKTENNQINLFRSLLKKSFGGRLIGIIGYGSFFIKPETAQDIDLIIILDKKKKNDLQKIRGFGEHSFSSKIQAQIIYKNKTLSNGNFYSINTCGPFFIEVIRKSGRVIYGKNIFAKIKKPKTTILKISILQKIQQYNYQLKNFYLNSGKMPNKKEVEYFILKKMKCLLTDINLFSNQIQHKKIGAKIERFLKKNPQINNNKYFLEAIDIVEEALFTLISHIHMHNNIQYVD